MKVWNRCIDICTTTCSPEVNFFFSIILLPVPNVDIKVASSARVVQQHWVVENLTLSGSYAPPHSPPHLPSVAAKSI